MTYEEKKELCNTKNVTLDGKPATINGARMSFAMVRQLDGYGYQWSWHTVKHIVNHKEGKFRSWG